MGKFLQVDPMADKYASATTYNYAFNNPVVLNDPMGDDPDNPARGFHWWMYNHNGTPRNQGMQDAHAGGMNGDAWNALTYGLPMGTSIGRTTYKGPSYFHDAALVRSNQMTLEEYAAKYRSLSANFVVTVGGQLHAMLIYQNEVDGSSSTSLTPIDEFGEKTGDTEILSYLPQTAPETVGQPGTLESLIPIWGSGRAAVDDFQSGRYGWAIVNGALAVSDVFLVKSLFTAGGKLIFKSAAKGGFNVASSAGGATLPMTVQKIIPQGTKISTVVNDIKGMTWMTGNEHAVVRLANGKKAIVSGGPGGISFMQGQIKTLFGHIHPTSAPPSFADYNALRMLGQSRQYVIHGGQTTLIRP